MVIMSVMAILAGFAAGAGCGKLVQKPEESTLHARAASAAAVGLLILGGLLGILWCFMSPPVFSVRIPGPPAFLRNDPSRSVYLGNGCFWHTQYDFAVLEQDERGAFAGRNDSDVTSLVGYAGGTYQSPSGAVCYHGLPGTDYSRMGHAEAVSITLDSIHGPKAQAQVAALAKVYFEHGFQTLPDGRRQRLDPQDMGAEYRNVIGLPGGMDNSELWPIFEAANVYSMQFARGVGGLEGDVEGEFVVYVYDSVQFPFFRGEAHHQFHTNDVIKRSVPSSYKKTLKGVQEALGRIDESDRGCVQLPLAELTLLIEFSFASLLSLGCALLYRCWVVRYFKPRCSWWHRFRTHEEPSNDIER
eukprot:TRINITY_DN37778_c0_g1_i3.p1 TRINITY_DN37778_c0_g1~~TRINITY_DN37778_c0_g1_i3.p1  ORF type:complete len:358 (-),score=50.25 TRINITY_DN37778_c0_g1_i3:157-1230(-)